MGEVMLCAGSIGSPQILQLSGIGPAALLQQHGIAVVQDLPGVGANLQDHLQIRSVYKVSDGSSWGLSLNTMANSLWGKARIGLEYALQRSRPDEHGAVAAGRLHPQLARPALPQHRVPRAAAVAGRLRRAAAQLQCLHRQRLQPEPDQPGHACTSRAASFEDAPAIAPNYLSTAEDRQVAADSLRVTRKIVGQRALAQYQPEEFKPGVQFQSDEDLARLAGDIATTIFHPVGTTKMGRADDPMAVVDSHLRVRGMRGLRVVDAGVMPADHQRQHQLAHADDCREGGAVDHRGRAQGVANLLANHTLSRSNRREDGDPPAVRRIAEVQEPLYAKLWGIEAGPGQAATLRFGGRLRRLPCGARSLAASPNLTAFTAVHCAQTVATSQFTKRAARAGLGLVSRRHTGAPRPARAALCASTGGVRRNRRCYDLAAGGVRQGRFVRDEKRSAGVGARSALRDLTRRDC